MIRYIVLAGVFVVLFLILAFRKPTWIEQITPSGGTIYICSHCGLTFVPDHWKGLPVTAPPDVCPNCTRQMRKRR